MANLGIVGDTHFPAVHPGYRSFCLDTFSKYRCSSYLHIGDVCDWHAISFHLQLPEAPGPKHEWEEACLHAKRWHADLPGMYVMEGNHDQRLVRLAATVKIPAEFLKSHNDILNTPTWKWHRDKVIDGVYYFHGTGHSGKYPAAVAVEKMHMSLAMGHVHSAGQICWSANKYARYFGMSVGCGVDDKHLAMLYGINVPKKSILSCAVVLDGTPIHVIMPCSPGEKYHASRFKKPKRKR